MQDAYWSINFELLKDLEILCSKKGKQSKTNESYDEKDSFPVQKSVTGVQTKTSPFFKFEYIVFKIKIKELSPHRPAKKCQNKVLFHIKKIQG